VNATSPDLREVDELCRLATVARRLGCLVHVVGADDELRELLELSGVADVLLTCPAEQPNPLAPHSRGDVR
jgi:hypothetical protein